MKNQKGITLIALIITIIVMLILVGVSVTVALNGGLFSTAKDAVEETKTARDEELLMTEEGYIEAVANKMEVGTEVTIGETGENFYVIKDEGAKLVLLAKKNIALDAETQKYVQADGINPVEFSNDSYWISEEEKTDFDNCVDNYENTGDYNAYDAYYVKWGKTYPRNLNNEEYDSVRGNDAVAKARQYAENTIGNGATGRLMTLRRS